MSTKFELDCIRLLAPNRSFMGIGNIALTLRTAETSLGFGLLASPEITMPLLSEHKKGLKDA
jgi:hypothetical protein